MALIRCPECGNEVSTEAETCPHCGYPIKKGSANKNNYKSNSILSTNAIWVNTWQKKLRKLRVTLGIIFLVCLIICITVCPFLLGVLINNYFVIGIILLYLGIFSFALFIVSLTRFRIKYRECDGHVVMVYNSFHNILVVDNVVQDKQLFNRYLYGTLPNGRKIFVTISHWDGSIKITFNGETNF